jgi:hypothetical protein
MPGYRPVNAVQALSGLFNAGVVATEAVIVMGAAMMTRIKGAVDVAVTAFAENFLWGREGGVI